MPVCRLIPFHPRAFSMHYTRGRRQDRHYSMGFGAISHFFPAMKRDCEKSTAPTCPAETCTTAASAGGLTVVFGNGEGRSTPSIGVLRSWGLLGVRSSTVAALLDLELGTSELTTRRAPLATCKQGWPLSDPREARCWRHGRSVPRQRRGSGPGSGVEVSPPPPVLQPTPPPTPIPRVPHSSLPHPP